MEVIPAIDIRNGKCVRLFQGDYSRETIYSDDPVKTACLWVKAGARRLHVVDLDGARDGIPANLSFTQAIASTTGVPVQAGGGIRSISAAKSLIDAGIDRIIFGTVAIESPEKVKIAIREFGAERVIVSVDAIHGSVATHGWLKKSDMSAIELFCKMSDLGVRRFMHTDITRDGTLSHPNITAFASILEAVKSPIIAAGGIATIEDLINLADAGAEAVVIGKAIYTGGIDLSEAIRVVSET